MTVTIEQVIPDGYCLRCRGCCRFSKNEGPWLPHLLESEKELRGEVPIAACGEGEESAFRCGYLESAGNSCAIYAARPFECRLYPFVLNRRGSRYFLSVDPQCPFIRERGESEELTGYGVRLAEFLRNTCRGLLAGNRHLFQEYSDVKDIAELTV